MRKQLPTDLGRYAYCDLDKSQLQKFRQKTEGSDLMKTWDYVIFLLEGGIQIGFVVFWD